MKPGYKLIAAATIILAAHTYHKKEIDRYEHDLRQNRITYEALLTSQEVRLKDYFISMGSPTPVTAAKAVSKSKRKHLAAATLKKESQANFKAVGDHGASLGGYQIQPRHWGEVPKSAEGQTQKYDYVMDALEREFGNDAVRHYNGSGPQARKYKKEVVSEAIRLAQEIGE
jgi:hypothetical protein